MLSRLGLDLPEWDADVVAVLGCIEQLPALVSLHVDSGGLLATPPQLARLSGLTQLVLQAELLDGRPEQDEDAGGEAGGAMAFHGQQLQAVGTLTNLVSLGLFLERGLWAPSERGWLSRLCLLTSLEIQYGVYDHESLQGSPAPADEPPRGAFNEVVAALPHLPHLRSLRLDGNGGAIRELPDVCERLVGAFAGPAALQRLHLDRVVLPPSCGVGVFSQLTGLTCLHLHRCFSSEAVDFAGLAALTNLRDLDLRHTPRMGFWYPPPPFSTISCLTKLTALALRGWNAQPPGEPCGCANGAYLGQVCGALWQLRQLDVRGNSEVGVGLGALRGLTNLEELWLTVGVAQLKAHLQAPPSLRCCMLQHLARAADQRQVRALFGKHVEVIFDELCRTHRHECSE